MKTTNENYNLIPLSEIEDFTSPYGSKCPECLQPTEQAELDMFGGLCEECSGAFDD